MQKNWCTVTVAPTVEHHGGHSLTPANQRWDQVPWRSQRLLLASRTRHEFQNNRITMNKRIAKVKHIKRVSMLNMKLRNTCKAHKSFHYINITTQSVSSPRTPHMPKMHIATFIFDLHAKSIKFILSPWLTCSPSLMKKHMNVHMKKRLRLYRVNKLVSNIWLCQLWPWPLTSKIDMVYFLAIVNMSSKFNEEEHIGLVSFVCTSLIVYISILTLTFGILYGSILLILLTCLRSLMKKHTTV